MSFFAPQKSIYIFGPSKKVPSKKVSNEDFLRWTGLQSAFKVRSEWIEKNSGIQFRHWVPEDFSCSDLAMEAAEYFFSMHPSLQEKIKNIILSSSSPDFISPPTSPFLQHRLRLKDVGCIDMSAACAGFVAGLHMAGIFQQATNQTQLLISADVRSKFLNPKDLPVSSLFGDGAAVCAVQEQNNSGESSADFKILASRMSTDGSIADTISIPAGGSKKPSWQTESKDEYFIHMKNGVEVFHRAVHGIVDISNFLLKDFAISVSDIDWFVPHQGNIHLGRQACELLGFPREKMVETIQDYGNTSGSSTGMALACLMESGRLQKGQKILLAASGGGGVGASCILESLK